jgi:hypothetical protein
MRFPSRLLHTLAPYVRVPSFATRTSMPSAIEAALEPTSVTVEVHQDCLLLPCPRRCRPRRGALISIAGFYVRRRRLNGRERWMMNCSAV